MARPVQISVCGSARSDRELDSLAVAVGARLARGGARVVCGGGPGAMAAVARGAVEAGGEVVGVLRGTEPAEADEHCTHVVATGIGQARNLAVVASGDAVIALGGEWGTLSEIAFARRLERTVVCLDSWSVRGRGAMAEPPGIEVAGDPDEAVEIALRAAADRLALSDLGRGSSVGRAHD